MKALGFELRLKPQQHHVTVEDYRRAARRRLPDMIWSFLDGGADDLFTLTQNRAGFAEWSLRSRVLTAKGKPDLSATVAGSKVSMPVLIAPTGLSGFCHWTGDIAAVKAAEAAGTRMAVSTMSSYSIEEISAAARESHIFQLYPREGDIAARLMARAWQAGFRTLFLTVDVPIVGNREGERRTGMGVAGKLPVLTPRRALNFARHPRWVYDVFRHGRVSGRNLVASGSISAAIQATEAQARQLAQSALSWDDVAWIRDQWKGRIYIKGILDPEDAARAVSVGADGVVVSNHGGRQLDFALSSIAALPAVVDAVGKRAEVLLDSGVRRGTDVIKAVALGASGVLVGRPWLYGLTVEGQTGIERVLEIFRSEIERSLILMGVGSISELDRSWLIPRGSGGDATDPSLDFDQAVRPAALIA